MTRESSPSSRRSNIMLKNIWSQYIWLLAQHNDGKLESSVVSSSSSSTLFQAHDPHGVQGVNERETQAEPLPVGLGDGPQLVVAPGELLVAPPRVPEGLPHRLQPQSLWRTHHNTGTVRPSGSFFYWAAVSYQ